MDVEAWREPQGGAIIGDRYRARREIARGAMGIVSECLHETLRAPVAVKTLSRRAAQWPNGRLRFMREGRLLALCRHPNVTNVLDAGVCATHGPFLVLEMVDGRSLDSLIVTRGRLGPRLVASLAGQLAAALGAVHGAGVVHRDVKPANVLVSGVDRGDEASARLIDFGVAGVLGGTVDEPKMTLGGEWLGTPEFMAPEVLVHQAPATSASDVYSLAVTLYECATGTLPFEGGPGAMLAARAAGPGRVELEALGPEVPTDLAEIVWRGLSPRASERPTIEEVGAVARGALARTAPSAPGSPVRRRFDRAPYSAPARVLAGDRVLDGRTEDVAEGGALVVVGEGCRSGARVELRFPLPRSGRVVHAQAVVQWAKSQRGRAALGLAFDDLPVDAAQELREFVSLMRTGIVRAGVAEETWASDVA